ncbi:DMT family transporter [Actinoplanes sp. NBRC 103695]|uniref:DMT family transporter n=1 Tax=Actinoplanes sp. NBRC 103695 TaxID=3032202 RepID=UPI0024A01A97|nr:DMT family transporter [Actinoplanes sp. NBRC 103695]GLY95861.1 hypothetical protein Acsp02_31160 [Actinoplanes sp. NBRC 103695]
MNDRSSRARLLAESAALIVLLASTWLIVGASLQGASVAVVSAGRTGFAVLGLAALTWWPASRASTTSEDVTVAPAYRWWQLLLLALTGVTAYTVLSTMAIHLAGPALPTLVLALTPAVVLAAESVPARARPPAIAIAGTGLAVAGAILYVIPRLAGSLGRDVALGALSAAGAMLSMAFYTIYFATVNRHHRGAMAPRIMPVFAVGAIPLVVWAGTDVAGGATVGWPVIGMLAFLGIVIYVPAYLLQHRILLSGGPSYAALLGLAVPPLVGVSSALLHLSLFPTPLQIAGTAVTLLGMVLVIRRR